MTGSATSEVPFFETLWQGEGIGDGADLGEALLAFAAARPGGDDWNGDWEALVASCDADPHLLRYASFEAFLDNADALERIPVSAAMIATALAHRG
jgi:hypothetical protein